MVVIAGSSMACVAPRCTPDSHAMQWLEFSPALRPSHVLRVVAASVSQAPGYWFGGIPRAWYNQQAAIQRSKLVRDQRIAAAGPPDHLLGRAITGSLRSMGVPSTLTLGSTRL